MRIISKRKGVRARRALGHWETGYWDSDVALCARLFT